MTFNYTKKNPYEDANVIKAASDKAAHEATKLADWTGGTYGQSMQNTLDKINNREKFTYDLDGDALYNQYKDQYINAGRLAMADTMGQAAAMTGGYGNSYAATVGNQAYQGYLQKLNDKVPELYQMALNRYNQEGQDLKDNLAIQQALYNTEYGEYRDKVADWNTQQNRLDSLWAAALEHATNESNTDYNNAFARYQQQIAEDQWNKSFAEQQRQYNASVSASRAAASQSDKINELSGQLKYYQVLEKLDGGIKTSTMQKGGTRSNEAANTKKQYIVLGKIYSTYDKARDAVLSYLDESGITDEDQINTILDRINIH